MAPIGFEKINSSYSQGLTDQQRAKRKVAKENVAEGVGVTGAVTYQARQFATKRSINTMMENVTNAARLTAQNTKEATTLLGKFKLDIGRFTKDVTARVMKLQNMKFIGPIVKSPVVKGACGAFGFTMAFFALVTGVNKAVDNGRMAIGDFQNRFNRAA